MMATKEMTPAPPDSPESRRYNRIKRWLGLADFVIGFGLLVVLLSTGWTGTLRDLAERGASQNYSFAVFLYVLMLMLINRADLMGAHRNTRVWNVIAWATSIIVIGMTLVMLWGLIPGH